MSFLFTFTAARVLVFLIVARRIPDVYLHLGGTHVHHLNYGIVLLSAVGAYLLLGHHWVTAVALAVVVSGFGILLLDSLRYADRLLLRIEIMERSRPPLQ